MSQPPSRLDRLIRASMAALIGRPAVSLGLLLLATAFFAYSALSLPTDFRPGAFLLEDTEDARLWLRMGEVFGDNDDIIFIMTRTEDVFTPEHFAFTRSLISRMQGIPHVVEVQGLTNAVYFEPDGEGGFVVAPIVFDESDSADGLALARALFLPEEGEAFYEGLLLNAGATVSSVMVRTENHHDGDEERQRLVSQILNAAKAEIAAANHIDEWHLSGIPVIQASYFQSAIRDQAKFIAVIGIVFIVILGGLFRHLLGMIGPLATVGLANVWTLGTMSLLGMELTIIMVSMPTIIAVYGTANAIHVLMRYREELGHGLAKREAILEAMTHLGRACFLTSFTTFVGFVSLMVAHNKVVASFGLATGMGIMLAFVISMIFLPPLMALMPVMQPLRAHDSDAGALSRPLDACARWATQNRSAIFAVTAVSLAGLGVLAAQVNRDTHLLEELRRSHPVAQSFRFAEEHLAGFLDFEVYVRFEEAGRAFTPEALRFVEKLEAFLAADPAITEVVGLASMAKAMNMAASGMDPDAYALPETGERTTELFETYSGLETDARIVSQVASEDGTELRIFGLRHDFGTDRFFELKGEVDAFLAEHTPPGATAKVAGIGLLTNKSFSYIVKDMMASVSLAFLIISFTLAVAFRSISLGVVAMVPNVMPLIASLAAMSLSGINLRTATVIIFSVSLGIAVDDTIHFIARYVEELRKSRTVEEAVQRTVRTTGRAMIFTSVMFIGGFLILVVSDFRAIVHFGILTSVAIASAILADLVVTPAVIALMKPGVRREA